MDICCTPCKMKARFLLLFLRVKSTIPVTIKKKKKKRKDSNSRKTFGKQEEVVVIYVCVINFKAGRCLGRVWKSTNLYLNWYNWNEIYFFLFKKKERKEKRNEATFNLWDTIGFVTSFHLSLFFCSFPWPLLLALLPFLFFFRSSNGVSASLLPV